MSPIFRESFFLWMTAHVQGNWWATTLNGTCREPEENDQKYSLMEKKVKHREVCTRGQEGNLGGLTSHRDQKNNKNTNNEFTSAAAERKRTNCSNRHAQVSRNTAGKIRSPCEELLEAPSGTRGEKLCSQLPSPVHSRKRIGRHTKFSKKVKARIVEKNGINVKLGTRKGSQGHPPPWFENSAK